MIKRLFGQVHNDIPLVKERRRADKQYIYKEYMIDLKWLALDFFLEFFKHSPAVCFSDKMLTRFVWRLR